MNSNDKVVVFFGGLIVFVAVFGLCLIETHRHLVANECIEAAKVPVELEECK